MNEQAKVIKVGNTDPSGNGMNGNVYHEDGLAPTLTTNKGEGNKILIRDKSKGGVPIKNGTKIGYLMAYDGDGVDLAYPSSTARRGRVQPQSCQTIQTTQTLGVMLFED